MSDPVSAGNGFLSYNASTKVFSIGSSTISSVDIENAVGSLVKVSPSTDGLIVNQTDPLDKFLQIDDVYINNLVNLVNSLPLQQFDRKQYRVPIRKKENQIKFLQFRELENQS